jgi:hypothetical protein
MNTQTQNFGTQAKIPNLERFGKELHDLGDKIERIAEKLKTQGVPESKALYDIGNEVEHFCDQLITSTSEVQLASTWTAPGAEVPSTPTTAQLDSSSTVNKGQASG